MKLYYTLKEAADILRCSSQTVTRRVNEGIIPTHPGDKGLIPREYVENWDIDLGKETFRERKLKQQLEERDKTILDLKNKIRQITRIGLEVEI